MTRKDYELIADTIRETLEWYEESPDRKFPIAKVAITFAFALQNENARFDRAKFLKACGF
jgi:hypothetical protein